MAFRYKLLGYLMLINFHLLYSRNLIKLSSSTLKVLPDSIQLKIECVINKNTGLIKIKHFIEENPNPKYFRHDIILMKQKKMLSKNLILLNEGDNYTQNKIYFKVTVPQTEAFSHVDIQIEKFIQVENLFFIYGAIKYHRYHLLGIETSLNFLIIFSNNKNSNVVYSILYMEKKLFGFNWAINFDSYSLIGENFLLHYLMKQNLEDYLTNSN